MARLSRGLSRGRVVPRRRKVWGLGVGGTAVTSLSVTGAQFVGSAVTPTVDDLTLMRTRGMLNLVGLTSDAAGVGFQGAFGIAVATAAAVTAGIASVPTPLTEQAWDGWLYWTPISIHRGDSAFANGSFR